MTFRWILDFRRTMLFLSNLKHNYVEKILWNTELFVLQNRIQPTGHTCTYFQSFHLRKHIFIWKLYSIFSLLSGKTSKFMFKLIPQKTLLIPFRSQKFLLGTRKDRYSRLEVLYKRFVLRNFAKFFGKHLSSEFLYLRSCELTKFFKKTYLVEHLRTAYRRM